MSTLKTNAIQNTSGKPILNSTGGILQVVEGIKTDTFYSSSQETDVDIGLQASITPSSTSSKILICVTLGKVSGLNNNVFRILRNGSFFKSPASASSRQLRHFSSSNQGCDANHANGGFGMTLLDSPGTTSALTYKVQGRPEFISGQGLGINRSHNDNNATQGYNARCVSTIVLMEVS